ncbi:MAG: DUF3566 domain-containing protein [Propionibacteriaceae bacterium]|nr:DUF3566 domain-containing protein [Propionibacteriaceae bacterium]
MSEDWADTVVKLPRIPAEGPMPELDATPVVPKSPAPKPKPVLPAPPAVRAPGAAPTADQLAPVVETPVRRGGFVSKFLRQGAGRPTVDLGRSQTPPPAAPSAKTSAPAAAPAKAPAPASTPTAKAPSKRPAGVPAQQPVKPSAPSGKALVPTPAPAPVPTPVPQAVPTPPKSAPVFVDPEPTRTGGPAVEVLPAAKKRSRSGPRRAHLRISRIDPWSVMKVTFLFSIAFGIMMFVAVYAAWEVIEASGLFDSVNDFVRNIITSSADTQQWDIRDYVSANKVLGITSLVSVINVVIVTALGTLLAFLYNLSSTAIGGVEVTLTED